ncbi:Fc.00g042990.m01.CDS01 [Cosmosporella sp. VM-42]
MYVVDWLLQCLRRVLSHGNDADCNCEPRSGQGDIAALTARLQALSPAINAVCQVSGNAGLSFSVLRGGQVIHRANFGFRDVQAQIPPDSNTVYHLASLSEEAPIKEYFGEFKSENSQVEGSGNIIDLLAHRTALAKNAYITTGHRIHLVPKDETLQTTASLEPAGTFRQDFKYNNWLYDLAGNIIEAVAGESLVVPREENYAQCYAARDSGLPYHIPRPTTTDKTSLAGAQDLKISVEDLLIYYGSLLKAAVHQSETSSSSTPENPFVEAAALVTPHAIVSKSPQVQNYGLGLILITLPGVLGANGTKWKRSW